MIVVNQQSCDQCATCVAVCPVDAILLDERLTIDSGKCIGCGKCACVCPFGALSEVSGQPAGAGKE
jgi:Fe-S-cluster-containing hydrogenase component 2